jgi:hypothetical protein
MGDWNIQGELTGLKRCPHCSIANPGMRHLWTSGPLARSDNAHQARLWATYQCTSCAEVILTRCHITPRVNGQWVHNLKIENIYPRTKSAHEDIPEPARTFLQQAYDTLHAPDAAAVMAGSAVDGMLKYHKLTEGSLYARIDQALESNLLTKGMADWAHSVRLGSNRPRHADSENPHVSPEQARQSVAFAEALGEFLFVLTARVERALEKTKPKPISAKRS